MEYTKIYNSQQNSYNYNMDDDDGLGNNNFNNTDHIYLQTQESRVSLAIDTEDPPSKIDNEIDHFLGRSSNNTAECSVHELEDDNDYVCLKSQDLDLIAEMEEDEKANSSSSGSPVFANMQNVVLSGCTTPKRRGNSPPTINYDQNDTFLQDSQNTGYENNNSMQISYMNTPVGSPNIPGDDMRRDVVSFNHVGVNVSFHEQVADSLPMPLSPEPQKLLKKVQMPEFCPRTTVQDQITVYPLPKTTTQEDENSFDLLRDPQNRSLKQLNTDADKYIRQEGSKQNNNRVWHCKIPDCSNNGGNGFKENCRARTHIHAEHFKIRYACPEEGCDYKCSRADNVSSHTELMHGYKLNKIPGDMRGRYRKGPSTGRKIKRTNYNLKQNEQCKPKKSKIY